MRGSARINDVRMAQFVLKIEKLSHIIGAPGSQDLRSPSPIMAPGGRKICLHEERKSVQRQFCDKMHYSALGAMMFIKLLLSLKAREYCVWQNKYFYDLTYIFRIFRVALNDQIFTFPKERANRYWAFAPWFINVNFTNVNVNFFLRNSFFCKNIKFIDCFAF